MCEIYIFLTNDIGSRSMRSYSCSCRSGINSADLIAIVVIIIIIWFDMVMIMIKNILIMINIRLVLLLVGVDSMIVNPSRIVKELSRDLMQ